VFGLNTPKPDLWMSFKPALPIGTPNNLLDKLLGAFKGVELKGGA
jgi:hypothetical protein